MESEGIMASPLHHRSDTHSIFKDSKRELPDMENGITALFIYLVDGGFLQKIVKE